MNKHMQKYPKRPHRFDDAIPADRHAAQYADAVRQYGSAGNALDW